MLTAVYHNVREFTARVLDDRGSGGGLVPQRISRQPPFTPHANPNPTRPTHLPGCMKRAFPMHAARRHVHLPVPGPAPDLSEDFAAVHAREI